MSKASVLMAGFACSPYTAAGEMRMHHDPKAIQVHQTVTAMLQVMPHITLWENVLNFYNLDHQHKLFTTAKQQLQLDYVPHGPLTISSSS